MAVDHGDAVERPARLGGGDDAGDLRFGHAGVMLDLQRREAAALVAAQADKARQGADLGPSGGQRPAFRRGVEILGLDADGGHG